MCRVVVFQDRNRWRVRVVDLDTRKAVTHRFDTEADARAAAPKLRREYARPVGRPMAEAIEAYAAKLKAKENKPRSIETTLGRIRDVFRQAELVTGELTLASALAAWQRYTTTPGCKSKRLPAVSTQANTLHEVRTFLAWLLSKGWIKMALLAGVEVEGKRGRRKPQLRREAARKLLPFALKLGADGDAGAVAAVVTLVLGLRASEVAKAVCGDLDDGGRVWVITDAKTEKGNREVCVPEILQPLLQRLAAGQPRSAKLFGAKADRFWVRHAVRRICRLAGVDIISAHGMRGTHASLAVSAGVSGLAVAASLGHESFAVTANHYATPESVAGAQVDRVLGALN